MPVRSRDPQTTEVQIYTDGGCDPNPGPGGWGAILVLDGQTQELTGGSHTTTNNRMELTAAIEALRALKRRYRVALHTDSQYLRRGITQWVAGWQAHGWKKANGQAVLNRDLWEALLAEAGKHEIAWHWTRGHAGNPLNERADALATRARHQLAPKKESIKAAWAKGGAAVVIYARGCALGSPGPGGHCAIVIADQSEGQAVCGGRRRATSNAMELEAVIAGLEAVPRASRITLHTPSKYVIQGATEWLPQWKSRGWLTADGKPVSNRAIWQRLEAAAARHEITWQHLAGSAPAQAQEAMHLARQEAARFQS
jgi:ribonuclease HI